MFSHICISNYTTRTNRSGQLDQTGNHNNSQLQKKKEKKKEERAHLKYYYDKFKDT
jgi:hypothetical protein